LAPTVQSPQPTAALRLKRLGIDTYREFVIYMNRNCEVYRSERFEVRSRVGVELNGRTIVATLNVVNDSLLSVHEASLSDAAWKALLAENDQMKMRKDPVAGSGKYHRLCWTTPVAHPARHRPKRPKTLA